MSSRAKLLFFERLNPYSWRKKKWLLSVMSESDYKPEALLNYLLMNIVLIMKIENYSEYRLCVMTISRYTAKKVWQFRSDKH